LLVGVSPDNEVVIQVKHVGNDGHSSVKTDETKITISSQESYFSFQPVLQFLFHGGLVDLVEEDIGIGNDVVKGGPVVERRHVRRCDLSPVDQMISLPSPAVGFITERHHVIIHEKA